MKAVAVVGDVTVECHGARLRAHARSRATVAVVSGQIDAYNADWVREMVRRCVAVGTVLVLDMSGVDFLGVQGLDALVALDGDCRKAGVEWALIASRAVYRAVGVGGRDGILPVVSSLAEAMQRPECARTLLRLVSHSDAGRTGQASVPPAETSPRLHGQVVTENPKGSSKPGQELGGGMGPAGVRAGPSWSAGWAHRFAK